MLTVVIRNVMDFHKFTREVLCFFYLPKNKSQAWAIHLYVKIFRSRVPMTMQRRVYNKQCMSEYIYSSKQMKNELVKRHILYAKSSYTMALPFVTPKVKMSIVKFVHLSLCYLGNVRDNIHMSFILKLTVRGLILYNHTLISVYGLKTMMRYIFKRYIWQEIN